MKKENKHKFFKRMAVFLCAFAAVVVLGVISVCAYSASNIDFSVDEALFDAAGSSNVTRLYYNGAAGLDGEEYLPIEYQSISGVESERAWYSINGISENIKNAFIATEDREFYNHHGVNVKRTAAALLGYITRSGSGFGASTITQQVIKNISGDNERTARRKLNEIIRAYHLEYSHSKDEIFEMYLNIVPMGEGASGVGMGARVYFSKEPSELTVPEAATLVGIANAPTRYNPYTAYDACLKKRNVVLSAMRDCGYINEDELIEYSSTPIYLSERKRTSDRVYSWFTETVIDEVCRDLVKELGYSYDAARLLIYRGGLSVWTTIDPRAQEILENYFENEIPDSDGRELSMVVLDPKTAQLRAVVGAAGEKRANRLMNYSLTPIIPGSTLKPIALYAPLIDEGRIRWSTVLDDVPVEFYGDNESGYREFPKNSPQVYNGLITVADGLAYSKNTVAVRLYGMLGKRKIFNLLRDDFGFDSLVESGAVNDLSVSPLALGQLSRGVSLRRLTEAYTVFSNDGVLNRGRSYLVCLGADGKPIIEGRTGEKRIFSSETAAIMTQMMMRGVEFGTASSVRLKELVDVAGKTGTSGGSKDKLFVGYTPYFVAGIWSGYPDRDKSVNDSLHLKIWDEVMHRLHDEEMGASEVIRGFSTKGLIRAPFCKDSGEMLSTNCLFDPRGSRLDYGYFKPSDIPSRICERHILTIRDGEELSLVEMPERVFPKEIDVRDEPYAYKKEEDLEE